MPVPLGSDGALVPTRADTITRGRLPHAWIRSDLDDRRGAAHRRPAVVHPRGSDRTGAGPRREEAGPRATEVRVAQAPTSIATVAAAGPQVGVVDDLPQPRAAQRPPWLSACSMTSTPPSRSSTAARAATATGHRQPVGRPAVERDLRVVVAHLGVDRHGPDGDVRRVADDDVDLAVEVVERPSSRRRAARRRRGRAGRGSRRPSRAPGRTARRRARVARGHLVLDRERDGARAGAQVDDQRRPATRRGRRRSRARPSTSVSGRGTKTPGPTARVRRRKWATPGEVLQRHARRALVDERGVGLGNRRRPRHAGPCARRTSDGSTPRACAASATASPPATRCRPRRGGPSPSTAPRVRRSAHRSARAARRAASSASTQDWITGSRSPSRTLSRLCALKPVRWSLIRFSGKL